MRQHDGDTIEILSDAGKHSHGNATEAAHRKPDVHGCTANVTRHHHFPAIQKDPPLSAVRRSIGSREANGEMGGVQTAWTS
ncbi:hypothetical protein GCM10007276_09730 [Agaricicola taiwanensis]|uniref:Uncharacterized protein n=1 Tax=Agaricicola taiwanensis TaxID=591372 RepID=A0A8J2VNE5_9RHOB|nr:hypothetical protein GCM10007276_09730 [Agaricicola taiwanensis]